MGGGDRPYAVLAWSQRAFPFLKERDSGSPVPNVTALRFLRPEIAQILATPVDGLITHLHL